MAASDEDAPQEAPRPVVGKQELWKQRKEPEGGALLVV